MLKQRVTSQRRLPIGNFGSPRTARFSVLATIIFALALSSAVAPKAQAMEEGDRNGYSDMQYYFNPWTPFKVAYKVVSYAVRVPIYILKAPWEIVRRQQEYENQG